MKLEKNNNGKYIWNLAVSSIKNNRMRNIFIILTIVLSATLLSGMLSFITAYFTSQERAVDKMQHVIYKDLNSEQIDALNNNENIEYLALNKFGKVISKDDYSFYPVYFPEEQGPIKQATVIEGTFPQELNEAAVFSGFLKALGKESRLGETFEITFLDGSSETFTVSGILDGNPNNKMYPFAVSKLYADQGGSMKEINYDALVKIKDAKSLTSEEFKRMAVDIASACKIERQNVSDNTYFADTLMGAKKLQIMGTAAGIAMGLIFVSILVIYSVFYISVVGRIRQFGQLRTIGMTKKQIRNMVTREGWILSAFAIPAGIVIGVIGGILLKPDGFSWTNTGVTVLMTVVIELLTVLCSIRRPAKMAAAVSPIEASRFNAYDGKIRKGNTRKLARKITPLSMAKMGFARNRKKSTLTMVSMGVGGILFMTASIYLNSFSQEGYSRQSEFSIGEYLISFSGNATQTLEHEYSDLQLDNPINDSLIDRIEQIDGVKKVYVNQKARVHYLMNGQSAVDGIMTFSRADVKEMQSEIKEGTLDYDRMTQNNEILVQNNALLKEIFGANLELGEKLELTFFNGNTVKETFTASAFMGADYNKNMDSSIIWMTEDSMRSIMGDINLNYALIVSTDQTKEAEITAALAKIVDGDQRIAMDTLQERMDADELSYTRLSGMLLGICCFIIAFSLINLVNTLITNIVTRKQEFAVLQSIGMTERQLSRMIQYEGFLLAAVNLVITLVVGTGAGILIIKIMDQIGVNYMHFKFPIWYFLGYGVFIILIPVLVSTAAISIFRKQPVVERIRETEG